MQHAQLALLVHMLLRLDQRAAWIDLSDNQHYHLELHAGSVQLALTLLDLGHNVIIALLGHTHISQGCCRVQTVKRGHIRYKVRHRAQLVLLGLPPLLAIQHAQLVLLVHIQLRLGRRAAWSDLSDKRH